MQCYDAQCWVTVLSTEKNKYFSVTKKEREKRKEKYLLVSTTNAFDTIWNLMQDLLQ